MTTQRWPYALAALVVLASVLAGCGGGSALAPVGPGGPGGGGIPPVSREEGTARFDVDVASGKVVVTPLEPSSRALFAGSTVRFNTSNLIEQPGSSGLRALSVSLTNRFGSPIGGGQLRVVLGRIRPGAPQRGDLMSATQVSGTSIGIAGLRGVSFMPDGSALVTTAGTGQLYRVSSGVARVFSGAGTSGYRDGAPEVARFNQPHDVIYDSKDRCYYVADTRNHRIRRVDGNGRVSTVAGTGVAGSADGAGNAATLTGPTMLELDNAGILLVSCEDGRIRRVQRTGSAVESAASYRVSTLSTGYDKPHGIAVAPDGHVYVAERGKNRIRVIAPSGSRTTIAGTGAAGVLDGAGNVATFNAPTGLAWVRDGLVVTEANSHRVRRVWPITGTLLTDAANWRVALMAGSLGGTSGNAIGTGHTSRFNVPFGLRGRADGTVLVVDVQNRAVRRVAVPMGLYDLGDGSSSSVEPVMVVNPTGWYGSPSTERQPYFDYPAGEEEQPPPGGLRPGRTTPRQEWWFNVPASIGTFSFIATVEGDTVGEALPEGSNGVTSPAVVLRTLIAKGPRFILGDASTARLAGGDVMAVARDGEVFLGGQWVYRYDPRTNYLSTVNKDTANGICAADSRTVYVSSGSQIYLLTCSDAEASESANWTRRVLIGTGSVGDDDGSGVGATLTAPGALAITRDGNTIWFTEPTKSRIRIARYMGGGRSTPSSWSVVTIAGGTTGAADGIGAAASFSADLDITVSQDNVAFVADRGNNRIRRVTLAGEVTTLCGSNSPTTVSSGYVDGAPRDARFQGLRSITTDSADYLYVTESFVYAGSPVSARVRRITPAGYATTVVNAGSNLAVVDGVGAQGSLRQPTGIATGPNGDLWLLDDNHLRTLSRVISSPTP